MAESARLFLKLTGDEQGWIKGEAEAVGFKDDIELDDWKWNLGTNQKNGDPEPSILGLSKRMCAATPKMLSAMKSGESMSAVITIEDVGIKGRGDKPIFQLILTLTHVQLTRYDMDVALEDTRGEIEESWDLNYETIKFAYRAVTHVGTMSVEFKRPAGASTDSPNKTETEILKLADTLGHDDLDKLWKKLKERFEAGRMGKKIPTDPENEEKK